MRSVTIFAIALFLLSVIHFSGNMRSGRATGLSDEIATVRERVDLKAYVPNDELVDNLGGEFMDDESEIIYATEEGSESDFTVEEFTEYDPYPSLATVTKIKTLHIPELQKVRDNISEPIIIRSAARTYEHEKKQVGQD